MFTVIFNSITVKNKIVNNIKPYLLRKYYCFFPRFFSIIEITATNIKNITTNYIKNPTKKLSCRLKGNFR